MIITLRLLLAHVLAAPVLAAALWRPARLLDGAAVAGALRDPVGLGAGLLAIVLAIPFT